MSRYRLEVRAGGRRQTLPIPSEGLVTIGRDEDSTVVLQHTLVSAAHAQIMVEGDRARIRDLDSKNGTWLNGDRLEGESAFSIGDVVVIGGVTLRLLPGSPADTSVTLVGAEKENTQVFASIDTGAGTATERDVFQHLKVAGRNLAIVHALGELSLEARSEKGLLDGMLDLVFDVLPVDRAAVILLREDGEPDLEGAHARSRGEPGLQLPSTILRRTLEEGIAILSADAAVDERFRDGRSVVLQGVRSAMCAPIRGRRSVMGAIYTDSLMRRGAFRPEDLELLTLVGLQGGVALESLRLSRAHLEQERLVAIGGVIAGLSHDIRNILTTLRGGAYVMDQMVTKLKEPDLEEAWDLVRQGTDTITVLVEDMVSYSKTRVPERVETDLNAIVLLVAERLSERLDEQGVELVTDLSEEFGDVAVDGPAMDRVLMNLLTNALDAIEGEDGRIEVRTAPALDGDWVEVTVEDNGSGIPEEHRDRIFDLLFSTKGSKGTGFGLAVTRKIVNEHGGRVTLESGVGEGARFRILLPRG